jgi:hypothetical protein
MSNYSAIIISLPKLRKHPNADRLQLCSLFGNQVIVGADAKEGQLGVYFPVECQISEEFARENDLVRRKDANGKPAGGMLESNRRVRAIKLRGEKSEGLWLPFESLMHTGMVTAEELFEFEEFNGHPVCKKYTIVSRGTNTTPKQGKKPKESIIVDNQFRFHMDTAQLGKNVQKINPDDLIVVTWKMHGTSAIASHCLVKKKMNWFMRLLAKFLPIITTEYKYIYASRRVIKNDDREHFHFYGSDIWSQVGYNKFFGLLHQGETVYYEIVGFTEEGAWIQKDFDYGCMPDGFSVPKWKVYVYRITQTTPEGHVIELSWKQVKQRCVQIGVNYTPEIFHGKAFDLQTIEGENFHDRFLAYLKNEYVRDQDSQFCHNPVPEEGVCVRVERGLDIEIYKLKSFRFLEYETMSLDKAETNIEDEQAAA